MRPYPAYKDSGVDWLGEVPEGWDVVDLKHTCNVFPSNVDKHSHPEEIPVRLCNYTDVYYNDRITFAIDFMQATATEEEIAKFTLQVGDVLFTKDSETADDIGIAALVTEELPGVICGYHLSIARPGPCVDGRFIKAYFDSRAAKAHFEVNANGLTRVGLGQYAVDKLPVPLPPLPEQQAIALFLDKEVAKIDALVAEQRRLIALLAEKRQAVISHAVTKGLNPATPLKPSGIDWLGDIPEGWEVVPLKYLVSFKSGGTPSKDRLDYWDGDLPWASAKDLKEEYLADTQLHITQAAVDAGAACLEPAGSVLVLVRGMTLAKAFPVCLATRPMAINQDLKAIQCGSRVTNEFLAWQLRGLEAESLSRIDEAGHGTKALRMEAWTSMEVALPAFPEQASISGALRKMTAELDALTAAATSAISLLQERRAALISAAVTGKIDLRPHSAQSLSEPEIA